MAMKLMITLTVIRQLSTHKNYQTVFRSYPSAIGGQAFASCLITKPATPTRRKLMPDWVVNIVSSESGEASFVVDGAAQGQPLEAHQDDTVSWNNQTNDEHQPWQTNSSYQPLDQSDLSDPIPAGEPSNSYNCTTPATNPQHWTVYYYCSRHPDNPNERGSIAVTAWPITFGGGGLAPQASTANYSKQDTIAWFNHSQQAHQPCQTDANYSPVTSPGSLSGVIQPGEQSSPYTVPPPPAGSPATYTIYYFCYLHQNVKNEQGKIIATPDG
jgi:hypothetical protein